MRIQTQKIPKIDDNNSIINHAGKIGPLRIPISVPNADTVFPVGMILEHKRVNVPVTYGMTVSDLRRILPMYCMPLREIEPEKWVVQHVVKNEKNSIISTELKPMQGKTLGDYGIVNQCFLHVALKQPIYSFKEYGTYHKDSLHYLNLNMDEDPISPNRIRNHLNQYGGLFKFTLIPYRLDTHDDDDDDDDFFFPMLRSRTEMIDKPIEIIFDPNRKTDPALEFSKISSWLRYYPFGDHLPGSWVRLSKREGAGPVNVWIRTRLTNALLPADDPLGFVADIWFIGGRLGFAWKATRAQTNVESLELKMTFDFFKRYMAIVNQAVDEYENDKLDRQTEFKLWPEKNDLVGDNLCQSDSDQSLWDFLKPIGMKENTVWTHTNKTNTIAEWDVEDPGTRFVYQYERKE